MADVFISYSKVDQSVASRLARALQAAGYEVWWDADLPAHRAYSEIIQRNLDEARAVVVLWSKTAAQSQWVRAEADFARNAGKLVQGQVDGSMPPIPFNQIQCADLKGWKGGSGHPGWVKLKGSVAALVTGRDEPAEAAPTGLVDRVRPFRWRIAAIVALLVAASAFLLFGSIPGEQHKPVVAVLPFRSLDPKDESLVAGMWEDTRTAIGRNPQLIVLGPNSAQQLAEKGEGAARKASDYLLEASVRRAGDRIRVSTQLLRTKDGQQIWTQDFDRKLDDVFTLQSEIATEIEGRIRGRLAEKGGITPEHIATSGEVYALYSDARAKIRRRDDDLYPAAQKQLEQVLKMDPNFAPAWASLASLTLVSALPSQKSPALYGRSEAFARKAIDLAPNLAAGHAALALALNQKGPVARAEIERALELDPNDYEALNWLGGMQSESGDKKGAIETFERAVAIEPFFVPAVGNLYSTLKELGDKEAIQRLLENENRVGADGLATSIEMGKMTNSGNLGQAANFGLRYYESGRKDRTVLDDPLVTVLLQLGFIDEVFGPNSDFRIPIARNDPKGLDLFEKHHIGPKEFFSRLLAEGVGRVYLLSGRGQKLADMYLSLKLSPEGLLELSNVSDPDQFLYVAPMVSITLKQGGHANDANALLSLAESKARERKSGTPDDAVFLARILAVANRKEEALPLLVDAVRRGWLPRPFGMESDLHNDPALENLKGDPSFERMRDQILSKFARERAKVDLNLVRKLAAP